MSLPAKPEVVGKRVFWSFLTSFWVSYVTRNIKINFPSVVVTSGQTGRRKKWLIFALINIDFEDSTNFGALFLIFVKNENYFRSNRTEDLLVALQRALL